MAGTGYSQLDSLSLMEKLLSRLAPPQQSGTTLANAGLVESTLASTGIVVPFVCIPKTYFYCYVCFLLTLTEVEKNSSGNM